MSVAAVLLAAGASRRLGEPKQLLRDEAGEPLVHLAARRLLEAGYSPVVVVLGAEADRVADAVRDLPVTCVVNVAHARGMGRSIAAGAAHIASLPSPPAIRALLVAACDMPGVDVPHLRALEAASAQGGRRVASAYEPVRAGEHAPVRGIPALFPREDWPHLLELDGDVGARSLLRDAQTLSVFLRDGSFDLDTPREVAEWRVRQASSPVSDPPATTPMTSVLQAALPDLEQEFANTRRMLERIPEAHLDFTPHEKSWPLGKLARHLCDFPTWTTVTLQTTTLDFDQPMPSKAMPTTTAGYLAMWDEAVAEMTPALAATRDEDLQVTWQALAGGHVVISGPRHQILRNMVLNHMIHHRAQLSIYYRLCGVPLPALYGPSADEQ